MLLNNIGAAEFLKNKHQFILLDTQAIFPFTCLPFYLSLFLALLSPYYVCNCIQWLICTQYLFIVGQVVLAWIWLHLPCQSWGTDVQYLFMTPSFSCSLFFENFTNYLLSFRIFVKHEQCLFWLQYVFRVKFISIILTNKFPKPASSSRVDIFNKGELNTSSKFMIKLNYFWIAYFFV